MEVCHGRMEKGLRLAAVHLALGAGISLCMGNEASPETPAERRGDEHRIGERGDDLRPRLGRD